MVSADQEKDQNCLTNFDKDRIRRLGGFSNIFVFIFLQTQKVISRSLIDSCKFTLVKEQIHEVFSPKHCVLRFFPF